MNNLKTRKRTLNASQTLPCDAGASVPPVSQVHLPVLYNEILNALCPRTTGRYVDATLGAGGHAQGILCACAPDGKLLGFEIDPVAIQFAKDNLAVFNERAHILQASYTNLVEELRKIHWEKVNGIVADFGVSSIQVDNASKGFSFLHDGPLDMRFNPNQKLTAADLINQLSEIDLSHLIKEYGEEPQARRIARAIISSRPLTSTFDLASVIKSALQEKHGRIHPATRTFQAIRIAVNDELAGIRSFLPQAVQSLKKGGRLAVISFHSLEDRIVKQFFHRESIDCICPPEQVICKCEHRASVKILTRHPIQAAELEITQNPRSRSARLRVIEKM